jgi:hypothetical protein
MINCLSIQSEGKLWTLYIKEREGKPNANSKSWSPMPSTSTEPSSCPRGPARPTGEAEASRGRRDQWGQARLVGTGETSGSRRGWCGQARPMGAVCRWAKSLVNTPPVAQGFPDEVKQNQRNQQKSQILLQVPNPKSRDNPSIQYRSNWNPTYTVQIQIHNLKQRKSQSPAHDPIRVQSPAQIRRD